MNLYAFFRTFHQITVSVFLGINDYRLTPVKPNDALIQEVIVESTQTNVYTVKLIPHKCGYNFTPLTAVAPLVSGGQVLVNEINRASRPLTGTFDVSFDGHKISGKVYVVYLYDKTKKLCGKHFFKKDMSPCLILFVI